MISFCLSLHKQRLLWYWHDLGWIEAALHQWRGDKRVRYLEEVGCTQNHGVG